MRQITREAVRAFMNKDNFKLSNTLVKYHQETNISSMFLFDNLIAMLNHDTQELTITNAGWYSNTTRERLNGLPRVSISQRNWQWFLNGQPWDGEAIVINLGV